MGLTSRERDIIRRIITLRTRCFGRRGRALFSKALGIKPSTYHPYEINRVPPAETLLRMAEVTGTDIRYILTGETQTSGLNAPGFDPLLSRVNRVIQTYPGSAQSLQAFLDLLEKMNSQPRRKADSFQPVNAASSLIAPILTRTAVGFPPAAHIPTVDEWTAKALAGLAEGSAQDARLFGIDHTDAQLIPVHQAPRAAVFTFKNPEQIGSFSVTQALQVYDAPADFKPLFALAVDGAAMAPAFDHGNLILISPNHLVPLADLPATGVVGVFEVKNQASLLVRVAVPEKGGLRLMSIVDTIAPIHLKADDITRAWKVLGRLDLPE